eukprot:CAMPEP_0204860848 /NCGR_PEP_ID=MMETSP1348-20121228/948_1 /ASSEMBLY_ACC=CAM_ASM_000700 /TAXON_ID=215587 /ORGANISM="Aplanochytrium stocchinoi, Strain GSBS06" /LENGTH=361 /DNA_ID=CAMNT_0052009865 /DNA_START=115 /DNA_END=1201 /DNA_ORIENTATION=+
MAPTCSVVVPFKTRELEFFQSSTSVAQVPMSRKRCRRESQNQITPCKTRTDEAVVQNPGLLGVPEEIWDNVLSFMEGKDLIRLMKSARFFKTYVSSPSCENIWQQRCVENSFGRIIWKAGEMQKTWYESFCLAKSKKVNAVALSDSEIEFNMDQPGAYCFLSVSALSNDDGAYPWDEESEEIIEMAMEEDEKYLKSQNKSLLPSCCIVSFQGYQLLFISRTNFEFAEGSNLVPVTAHHFHFQTTASETENNKVRRSAGILIAPTEFLADHFCYDFKEVRKHGYEQQLLIHSSFATEASTAHWQPKPVKAFKMHRLPTMDTVVQLFTMGPSLEAVTAKPCPFPEPSHNISMSPDISGRGIYV